MQTPVITVVGLGYVGLPLAVALAQHFPTHGYDISGDRIAELQQGHDRNGECADDALGTTTCHFHSDIKDLPDSDIYIITVPTPVNQDNKPDLAALQKASASIAPRLKKGDIVVYESTVYPGVTEDVCGPILEDGSGLACGADFFLGYSPERINPGDKVHTVDKITKVVAGQTTEVTEKLAHIYGRLNNNNIFRARNIKTAEAAKVIENAQRDINVAFVNEVALIASKLGLSTHDVLDAANTKWNFLPFTPGLVGGHCIGVDPYYLAECAEQVNHSPDVILAGRHTNDYIGARIADLIHQQLGERSKRVLILGFTFKENIPDIRNTRVIDVVRQLASYGHTVEVQDPQADTAEAKAYYQLNLHTTLPDQAPYDAIVLAVAHTAYESMGLEPLTSRLTPDGFIYDIKGRWRHDNKPEGLRYICL